MGSGIIISSDAGWERTQNSERRIKKDNLDICERYLFIQNKIVVGRDQKALPLPRKMPNTSQMNAVCDDRFEKEMHSLY